MNPALSASELNRQFGIPGIAKVVPGNGGLTTVRITTAMATGEIYLHGAHVTSFRPATADEVLFLSSASNWQEGKAIRGGVPISFPWFADRPTIRRLQRTDSSAQSHGRSTPSQKRQT